MSDYHKIDLTINKVCPFDFMTFRAKCEGCKYNLGIYKDICKCNYMFVPEEQSIQEEFSF